jgi:hypothetical protein
MAFDVKASSDFLFLIWLEELLMDNPEREKIEEAKRVRFTIELSRRLDEMLEGIAAENGQSKAEVLRFAIDFLGAGVKAKKEGMTVGGYTKDTDGNLKREREFVGI